MVIRKIHRIPLKKWGWDWFLSSPNCRFMQCEMSCRFNLHLYWYLSAHVTDTSILSPAVIEKAQVKCNHGCNEHVQVGLFTVFSFYLQNPSDFGLNEHVTTSLFSMFGNRRKHVINLVEYYTFETFVCMCASWLHIFLIILLIRPCNVI